MSGSARAIEPSTVGSFLGESVLAAFLHEYDFAVGKIRQNGRSLWWTNRPST